MARFWVLFAALLLATGSVVKTQDLEGSTDPDTTTTPKATTTTTTKATTTTTKATTTTTTTEPTTTTTPEPTTTTTETTTTTTAKTTTTESTTTTPATTTTTTEATTTTTAPPTTTTEKPKPPSPDINYNVTENNVTCIKVAGEILFNINYTLAHSNSTDIKTVFVPANDVATVTGSCNASDGQYISFSWGNNTVRMNFETADKDSWTFTDITASLYIDDHNATDYDKTLDLTVDYNLSPGEVSVDHSFVCRSIIKTNNVTAYIGKKEYGAPITSTLKNIQVQAFNTLKNGKEDESTFAPSVHCTADNTSDVVPIAVGCALAGLVVIVLIAYLVGRRKRSGAYQSV